MARKKPGRKPLGKRVAHTIRVPEEHMEHMEAEAVRLGYPNLNAYIASTLARVHDLEVPVWAERRHHQSGQDQLELPLGA